MKLIVDKLAKIFHAELDLNGITVIAGANNTGKSTIGKALYGMFCAFSKIDERERYGRKLKYLQLLLEFVDRFTVDGLKCDSHELAEDLVAGRTDLEELKEILSDSRSPGQEDPDIDEWISRFKAIASLSDDDIKCQEVLNALAGVFNSQCASLYYPESFPSFELEIKKMKLAAKLTPKLPVCSFGVNLKHAAFYIDSPDVLVDIEVSFTQRSYYHFGLLKSSRLSQTLVAKARHDFMSRIDGDTKAVDDLLVKGKFAQIESRLKQLMGGSLLLSKTQGLVFVDDTFPDNPIKIRGLSQGIKEMALLQAAFMNGTISDNDVLILDEPEIHLHPKWQVRYAEYIVLLQKAFSLTVLLTSHSPDFIEAIRLYSRKYGISNRLNCYVSRVLENGSVSMDPMPEDNWDDVFDSFGSSFDELTTLRLEVEGVPDEHE